MSDISKLFDEVLFPIELLHPLTKEAVGITFYLAPFEADATADWYMRTQAQYERMKGDVSADKIAEIDASVIIKRCAASIRKWDWGGNSCGALGIDPPCTLENKIAVLSDPHASWIVDQVFRAGIETANFTKKPDPI